MKAAAPLNERAFQSLSMIREARRGCKGRNVQKGLYFNVFFDPASPGGPFYRLSANPFAPVHFSSPQAKGAAALFFKIRKRTRAPAAGASAMRAAA